MHLRIYFFDYHIIKTKILKIVFIHEIKLKPYKNTTETCNHS